MICNKYCINKFVRNVGIIKKTCEYAGIPYPQSHTINWNDEKVWEDMKKSPIGIFQMEADYAFKILKDFGTKSIEDMSLVTAMIRPSGASYRDKLTKHIFNKNPSKMIDELLKDNLGYLVYQEDVIAFLQNICGLSGSEADNVRRAIGRKQYDRLQEALPSILEGYCNKSDKPREEAEEEAKIFLQIIEDASSYMFGKNHSIGYCMIGYLCAYLRYYYPYEFLTAFFNCSETEEDISNGTALAKLLKIKIKEPKFRYAKSDYFFDKENHIIYKGMSSIKYMNKSCADDLYELRENQYNYFIELLLDVANTSVNSRQLEILIKLDYFSEFGNAKELLRINEWFNNFKQGKAKSMSKSKITDEILLKIVERHSKVTEKTFTNLDTIGILKEIESFIRCSNLKDFSYKEKALEQMTYLGYINFSNDSDDMEERKKLIVLDIKPMKSKFGKNIGEIWGYAIKTQSIGSGKQGAFTILPNKFKEKPVHKLDIIYAINPYKKRDYWYLGDYDYII